MPRCPPRCLLRAFYYFNRSESSGCCRHSPNRDELRLAAKKKHKTKKKNTQKNKKKKKKNKKKKKEKQRRRTKTQKTEIRPGGHGSGAVAPSRELRRRLVGNHIYSSYWTGHYSLARFGRLGRANQGKHFIIALSGNSTAYLQTRSRPAGCLGKNTLVAVHAADHFSQQSLRMVAAASRPTPMIPFKPLSQILRRLARPGLFALGEATLLTGPLLWAVVAPEHRLHGLLSRVIASFSFDPSLSG